MLRSNFISILLTSLVFGSVSAQEKPKFAPVLFDESVNNRQNVCDRHNKYYNGDEKLRDTLQGFEIHALFDSYDEKLFMLKDGAVDEKNPGIFPILMDELARRAGFQWRNSFAVADLNNGLGGNKTWTDLLSWGTESFDLHVDWWINSVERLKMGVGFPEGFYDASYILIGVKAEDKAEKADLFNWLEPFESQLWWTILGTILISTLFYVLLEKLNPYRTEHKSISNSLFLSALVFTQHFQFTPKSHAARIFSASMAFWSLIIVATYTANLASFFVIQNTPDLQINSIDDAIRANLRMCVWEGTATAAYVTKTYPQGNFIFKPTDDESLLAVKDGDCDFAIVALQSWEQYKNDRDINSECNLSWVGRVIKFIDGGFATKNDAGVLCTSLIHDVLNIHLVEMHADGFIEKTWTDSFNKNQDLDCDQMSAANSDADAAKLSLDEMAGTFFLHSIAGVISLFVALFTIFKSKRSSSATKSPENNIDFVSAHSTDDKSIDNNHDIATVLADIQDQIKQMRSEQIEQRSMIKSVVDNKGVDTASVPF